MSRIRDRILEGIDKSVTRLGRIVEALFRVLRRGLELHRRCYQASAVSSGLSLFRPSPGPSKLRIRSSDRMSRKLKMQPMINNKAKKTHPGFSSTLLLTPPFLPAFSALLLLLSLRSAFSEYPYPLPVPVVSSKASSTLSAKTLYA